MEAVYSAPVGYPAGPDDKRIPAEILLEAVTSAFAAAGMLLGDAALVAETLVAADLRGVHSHGVLRVPDYVAKLTSGGVNPRGAPGIFRDSGSALVIDGGNSMGQVGGAFALRTIIERARTTGVAVAAVRGSNHCGAMAWYALQAVEQGMVGFATTNALPTMAPWGGLDKIIGINPLSVAAPAAQEHPLVIDTSFSNTSHGKIRVYEQKGLPIPSHWAYDVQGHPTTDASAAIEGFLQPIGGFKGVGLAVLMGVLSSLLSGAAYGTESGNMVEGPRPGVDGHFFLVLNVATFEDPDRFRSRVDGVIRELRQSRRAEGVDRIYAPGELEWETEKRYRLEGIPLNADTRRGLLKAAINTSASLPEDALSLLES